MLAGVQNESTDVDGGTADRSDGEALIDAILEFLLHPTDD
jgi:hypothetical protein